MFKLLKHFVSYGETLCFSLRNTLFLPEKLFLQIVRLMIYDVNYIRYDVYCHYLTLCLSIIYLQHDVMTLFFSNFAQNYKD